METSEPCERCPVCDRPRGAEMVVADAAEQCFRFDATSIASRPGRFSDCDAHRVNWRARARAAEQRLAALDVALVSYCKPDPVTGDDIVDRALLLQQVQRRLAGSVTDARIDLGVERLRGRGLLRAALDVIKHVGGFAASKGIGGDAMRACDRLDIEIRQFLGIDAEGKPVTTTMETNDR